MEKLRLLEIEVKDLESLPLFLKKIYCNKVTYLEDELKLYSYSEKFQSSSMRNYYPNRTICKTVNLRKFNEE